MFDGPTYTRSSSNELCASCLQDELGAFRCRSCGARRNRQVGRRASWMWGALLTVACGAIALSLIGTGLQERSREHEIEAKELQLAGQRAELASLKQRRVEMDSETQARKRAADKLEKRAPRLKKQLESANRDNDELRSTKATLQSAIDSGVLPPGVTI